MSRNAPMLMTAAGQPEELPGNAQAALEQDKLYFMEPKNKGILTLTRPLVPGEELPWKMPPEHTTVVVTRTRRSFLVLGVEALVIEDDEGLVVKRKKNHKIVDVAKLQGRERKLVEVKPRLVVSKEDEHAKQALRRAEKEALRQSRSAKTKIESSTV